MRCPDCQLDTLGVIDTQTSTEVSEVYRKRLCKSCGAVIMTRETIDASVTVNRHQQDYKRLRKMR